MSHGTNSIISGGETGLASHLVKFLIISNPRHHIILLFPLPPPPHPPPPPPANRHIRLGFHIGSLIIDLQMKSARQGR